jgi:uncharacterized SAM-dependent methyltransferase
MHSSEDSGYKIIRGGSFHKLASLAQVLDDLLRQKRMGHALPECFGDKTGTQNWAHFVRKSHPKIQYTFQSEAGAVDQNKDTIAKLVKNDPDFDRKGLIVVEKGGGSWEALLAKPFNLMRAFQSAGMRIAVYSNWERSAEYRLESDRAAGEIIPGATARSMDVDFNHDNPAIPANASGPRIVLEFGSSRGNIPTSANDHENFEGQTYKELQRRFAHDRKICRDGGLLIIGTDANQRADARDAYTHPVHAKFAENIVHRGAREGALSRTFNPDLLYYDPIWDQKNHVIRHTLIAAANQNFGILAANGFYRTASIKEDQHFVLSHSIKWPVQKMVMAAESQGFECLGVFWGEDRRVPVYVFKARPIKPALKLV